MPIPDYQDFMLPLLQAVLDGKDHHIRDVTTLLADSLGLSQGATFHQLLPSGQQSVVANPGRLGQDVPEEGRVAG